MNWLTKAFAALAAILGGLFLWKRRELEELEVARASEKDQAEGLALAATITGLEQKVTLDEKTTQSALADYDNYRATHPIDSGDGSGKRG